MCVSEVDECVSSPCVNGATCMEGMGGYNCSCVAGYEGLHCETGKIHQATHKTISPGVTVYHFYMLDNSDVLFENSNENLMKSKIFPIHC